ncbi:hypothetical protein V2J09_006474 [Rumex salicifolius]
MQFCSSKTIGILLRRNTLTSSFFQPRKEFCMVKFS